MGIKETPTNFRVYYKSMQEHITQQRKEAVEAYKELYQTQIDIYNDVKLNVGLYLECYNINLSEYPEFINNSYEDGSFLRMTKGAIFNVRGDNRLVGDLVHLHQCAKYRKNLYDLEKQIEKFDKFLKLSLKEYTEILRVFYFKVHELMITKGYGYVFENNTGWICINRVVSKGNRKLIDYAATKKKEAELKAAGVRIYNEKEADWCKRNGINYEAADKRVYKNDEYYYEIPLINCKIKGTEKFKFTVTDYRHASLRGKTNEQLLAEAHNNVDEIINIPIDIKTKLTLCDKVDKLLYLNFIRNENQESITTSKARRKN